MGRFLDGGLLANNPTLDAMSEIHQYNKAFKAEVGNLTAAFYCIYLMQMDFFIWLFICLLFFFFFNSS